MLGVLVNAVAVLIGSALGLLFHRSIPEKISSEIMKAIGLCTFFIGVQGAFKSENILVAIVSMVVGTAIGTGLDLDGRINGLAGKVEQKVQKNSNGQSGAFTQGLVTAFLLWCVGSMTIVGSLQAGIAHDYSMLYTKSLLDLISSAMLASSLGVGVIFATVPLIVFQGGLVLLSGLLEPILTASMINEIICVGSLSIIALGFNLLGIAKLKVANFLPAMLAAPFACLLIGLLGV